MGTIRIGIICPSEIAFRRFLPALQKDRRFVFIGIGVADAEEWYGKESQVSMEMEKDRLRREGEKADSFIEMCGCGKVFESYTSLITSEEVDAVYIPLPPALHYKWAMLALQNGKHVFVEKPATIDSKDTQHLIDMARRRGLAFHENYMFIYHNQLQAVNKVVDSGEIGDVRLYRISFGFPRRAQNDFRYNKALGGGALIDAGGYTLKYALYLLGPSARLTTAHLNYTDGFDVDMYGSATMINDEGVTAQLAFGMDNDYKCEIEIWGSKGTLMSNRILTAPAGFEPECIIKRGPECRTFKLPEDDTFFKSIDRFYDCMMNVEVRQEEYESICLGARLFTAFKDMCI